MENKRRDTLVPHFPSLSFFFFTSFPFLFLIFYFSFFFLSFFLESIVSIIHRTLLDANNGRMVDLGMVRDPSRICIILSVRKHFCREHTVKSYHLALYCWFQKFFEDLLFIDLLFIKEIFVKFRGFKKFLFFVFFFFFFK